MYKSVAKAIALIEFMAESEEPLRVSDLARKFGWPKSNVHQMLNTLLKLGWVQKNERNSHYELKLRIWQLGVGVQSRLRPNTVALPHMRTLADATGETVHLSVFEKDHVVYVDQIESVHPVRAYSRIGGIGPVHCTATGKAMLAFQTSDIIKANMRKLDAFTNKTITSSDELLAVLAEVQVKGYASSHEEWRSGVSGVGAPIADNSSTVVAALGISGPATRLTSKWCEEIGPLVRSLAQSASQELGYSGSAFPPPSPMPLQAENLKKATVNKAIQQATPKPAARSRRTRMEAGLP